MSHPRWWALAGTPLLQVLALFCAGVGVVMLLTSARLRMTGRKDSE
jgi:hypothetical protein